MTIYNLQSEIEENCWCCCPQICGCVCEKISDCWEVVIAGVINDTCTDCNLLNGVFILKRDIGSVLMPTAKFPSTIPANSTRACMFASCITPNLWGGVGPLPFCGQPIPGGLGSCVNLFMRFNDSAFGWSIGIEGVGEFWYLNAPGSPITQQFNCNGPNVFHLYPPNPWSSLPPWFYHGCHFPDTLTVEPYEGSCTDVVD